MARLNCLRSIPCFQGGGNSTRYGVERNKMIWLHRASWLIMSIVAFMTIPVIKAQAEIIEAATLSEVFIQLSLRALSNITL